MSTLPTASRDDAALDRAIFRRLLPILIVAYVISFLDRSNIALAKVHLQADLHLSAAAYGLGAGLFFLTYSLLEVPSNLLMHKLGARIWITRIMVTWGVVSGCMALVQGQTSFYLLRLVLGIAEAGFFPGVMLYFTYWFRPTQRARASGLFLLGVCAANALGGPVGGALLELDGLGGLHGWQWLFIVEAAPALVMAAVIWRYLPDRPETATWLTEDEVARISQATGNDDHAMKHVPWRTIFSPQILLVIVIYFCHQIAIYTTTFFLPGIIGTYGKLSPLAVGSLTSLPWLSAAIGTCVLFRIPLDVHRIRRVLVTGLLIMSVGLAMASLRSPVIALIGFCLAGTMFFVTEGILFTYPASWLRGSRLAAGLAFVNACGLTGGFLGPTVMGLIEQRTGRAASGLVIVAVLVFIVALLATRLRQRDETLGTTATLSESAYGD